MEKGLNDIKNSRKYLLFVFFVMWILVWSGYNTGIFRVMSEGFPHSLFDLIHGIRAFFPIFVGALALLFVFIKKRVGRKFLFTPLGFLMIYGIVGVFSSIISKNPVEGVYWALMYLSVIFVIQVILFEENAHRYISYVINLNWTIVLVLVVFLMLFFLFQPNVINSLNFYSLICSTRPYEGLGGVNAGIDTLGMPGTRPTGLGRYAGIVAIVAFCWFLFSQKKRRFFYFLLFILFLFLLLFSKGKTAVIAFIVAFIFVIFATRKFKKTIIFGLFLIILASLPIVILDIPCFNKLPSSNSNSNSIGQTPATTIINSNISIKMGTLTLNSRASVWAAASDSFFDAPLLGKGFYADKSLLTTHNTILQALVQTGILGTIPFVLAFLLTFITLLKLFANPVVLGKERNFLIIIASVLVFFVVRGLAESMAIYSADWLFVAPIIAYIQCLDQKLRLENRQKRMNFNGNKIDIIKIPEVLERINYWIRNEKNRLHWVIVTGMHGAVEASKHADFKYILRSADMWVPDGISLVWLAQLKGFNIKERVSGADLMQEVFKKNYNNFLYGDTQDTLFEVKNKFSNSKISFYSPPFRELTQEEDDEIIKKINDARPDILWVGLGLPKQEKWIFQHKDKLDVPVIIGVGAAFKFLAGTKKRAPKIIGNLGLEWLWRLLTEPKVVWKRVFIDMPYFFWLVVKGLFENNHKI